MESPDTSQLRKKPKAAPEQESSNAGASLFLRLWVYGAPGQPLSGLTLDSDPEVGALIRKLITDGIGQVTEHGPEGLVAHFDDSLFALSAAKTVQQRLLTFQRKQGPQQVVASILISEAASSEAAGEVDPSKEEAPAAQMIVDGSYSAQILVSEAIYAAAQQEPGFQFNPKPVREAGEGGATETVYELLWTDESTYGHLRQAGSTGIHTVGRYQIQSELGRGAMGVVYKAYDQLIGRTVALKTISIDRNAPNRKELIERLKREAKAAGGLDHPNIITIYDVGQEEDRVYLSMQYLEGKTLQAVLEKGELPALPTLLTYADQICSAVGYAHERNVIHRDLKPANLMLTSLGGIKVLDFGIAKIEDATLTQAGLVVGTPSHMAPEQASDRKIDHRSDIFALGSVFYELFTREKPFKGDVTTVLYKIIHEDPPPPAVINPGLPAGIDAIIRKALAKNPKDRFQSCEEMRKAFREQAKLLKPGSSSTTAATARPSSPAARPESYPFSYLLETTTVRAQRRLWPRLVGGVAMAAIGAAGWTFYVRANTGSFPPLVQKLVASVHPAPPPQNAEGSAQTTAGPSKQPAEPGNHQTTQSNGGTTSGSTLPADSNNTNPATSNASEAGSTPAQNSNAVPKPEQGQSTSGSNSTTPAKSATQPQDESRVTGAEPNPSETAKNAAAPEERVVTVEGFTRRDVPELLRQADAAAGRGDYRMARYEYNLILKLDRNNAAARAGVRRVQAAEQTQH
jgi:eukaryotic-like serine/threonine-protein kinase